MLSQHPPPSIPRGLPSEGVGKKQKREPWQPSGNVFEHSQVSRLTSLSPGVTLGEAQALNAKLLTTTNHSSYRKDGLVVWIHLFRTSRTRLRCQNAIPPTCITPTRTYRVSATQHIVLDDDNGKCRPRTLDSNGEGTVMDIRRVRRAGETCYDIQPAKCAGKEVGEAFDVGVGIGFGDEKIQGREDE